MRLIPLLTGALCALALFLYLPNSKSDSIIKDAHAELPAKHKPVVVLELFTSQGCSSCPPADKLLGEIAMKAKAQDLQVYPLSFHVDYWNNLGWRDPYSGKSATERQRDYARVFRNSSVYTPQLVINGIEDFVGSSRSKTERALERHLAQNSISSLRIESVKVKNRSVTVSYSSSDVPKSTMLRFALVDTKENFVERGENAGRMLSHTNVVRSLKSTEIDSGGTGKIDIEIPKGVSARDSTIVGILQDSNTMRIFGADAIELSTKEI